MAKSKKVVKPAKRLRKLENVIGQAFTSLKQNAAKKPKPRTIDVTPVVVPEPTAKKPRTKITDATVKEAFQRRNEPLDVVPEPAAKKKPFAKKKPESVAAVPADVREEAMADMVDAAPAVPKDAQTIARDKQLAEPPPPAIVRQMMHEVKVGDTVCYFADVDNKWEVLELRGPWLRAAKRDKDGHTMSQCFLTDTMIPLELAKRLPKWKEEDEADRPKAPRVASTGARRRKTAPPAPDAGTGEAAPRSKRSGPRGPRAPKVQGTATPEQKKAALKFLEKQREEHGVCEAIRSTVQHYPAMTRDEIVEVAAGAGINKSTAGTQFGVAHKHLI